ncbi:uncharacterized protein LOC135499621 [Lineus longissimus]|uniref:uncharacterized protein LOC135499621 n=1 Tax=Lineus longissimus TaxID=88925 RepID=UPI00315E004F
MEHVRQEVGLNSFACDFFQLFTKLVRLVPKITVDGKVTFAFLDVIEAISGQVLDDHFSQSLADKVASYSGLRVVFSIAADCSERHYFSGGDRCDDTLYIRCSAVCRDNLNVNDFWLGYCPSEWPELENVTQDFQSTMMKFGRDLIRSDILVPLFSGGQEDNRVDVFLSFLSLVRNFCQKKTKSSDWADWSSSSFDKNTLKWVFSILNFLNQQLDKSSEFDDTGFAFDTNVEANATIPRYLFSKSCWIRGRYFLVSFEKLEALRLAPHQAIFVSSEAESVAGTPLRDELDHQCEKGYEAAPSSSPSHMRNIFDSFSNSDIKLLSPIEEDTEGEVVATSLTDGTIRDAGELVWPIQTSVAQVCSEDDSVINQSARTEEAAPVLIPAPTSGTQRESNHNRKRDGEDDGYPCPDSEAIRYQYSYSELDPLQTVSTNEQLVSNDEQQPRITGDGESHPQSVAQVCSEDDSVINQGARTEEAAPILIPAPTSGTQRESIQKRKRDGGDDDDEADEDDLNDEQRPAEDPATMNAKETPALATISAPDAQPQKKKKKKRRRDDDHQSVLCTVEGSHLQTVPRVMCLEEGPTIALKEVSTTPAPVGTNDVHHQKKKKAKRARRVEHHHIVEEDGEGRFTNSETKHLPQAKAQHADSQQAEKERPSAPSPSPVVCSIVDGGESHLQVCTPSTKNKKTKPERNEHRASTKNRVRDKESSQSKKKKYQEGQQPSRRKCSSPVIQVQGFESASDRASVSGVATPQEVVSNTSFDTDPPSTSEDDSSEQGERADFNCFLCQEADAAEEGTLFHRLRARTNLALSKAELNVTRFLSNHYSFLYSNLTSETGRANFREYFHAGFEHFIELILEKEVQHKVFVRSSEYAKRVNKAQCLESE